MSTLCKYDLRKYDLFVLSRARVQRVRRRSVFSELLMCGGGVFCGWMSRDNRCVYMAHVCVYLCCSDYVGVCGNICCVAAIAEDSGF